MTKILNVKVVTQHLNHAFAVMIPLTLSSVLAGYIDNGDKCQNGGPYL